MTLNDFVLTDNNHFIGSQQYKFLFKRVFLVLITKNYLIGLVCNNSLSVETDTDILVNRQTVSTSKRGSFQNPYSYLKTKMVKKITNKYMFDQSIFAVDKANFRLDRNDVKSVTHSSSKATYLGNFPSDGSVFIETLEGVLLQFDLLGEQSGKDTAQSILARHQEKII